METNGDALAMQANGTEQLNKGHTVHSACIGSFAAAHCQLQTARLSFAAALAFSGHTHTLSHYCSRWPLFKLLSVRIDGFNLHCANGEEIFLTECNCHRICDAICMCLVIDSVSSTLYILWFVVSNSLRSSFAADRSMRHSGQTRSC